MFIGKAVAAGCAALVACSAAQAQDTSFRGFRVEAKAGADRFMAHGHHDDNGVYGGAAGWDGLIGERIVVGPEVSYLATTGVNCEPGGVNGRVCTRSREELGIAVRAGVLVTPKLLVYGKGGFAQDRQRRFLNTAAGATVYNDRYRTDGFQVGGGLEYTVGQRFYVSGEYRYANYYTHTSRNQLLGGVGIRF